MFAVNAGSNSVSSFIATPSGLKLVAVHNSGGNFPNSLTIHGNLLYVLDSGIFPMPGPAVPGNIAGLRFDAAGHLSRGLGLDPPVDADGSGAGTGRWASTTTASCSSSRCSAIRP